MDQVKTIYKISQILSNAFKEVNDVCAHYLADQSVQNNTKQQPKHAQKKTIQQKPKQKVIVSSEAQLKKEHKKQTKPKAQEVIEEERSVSPKPAIQSKPKTQQKQQPAISNQKNVHPDRPKQPLTAFFLFQQQQKPNVKKLHPQASITELSSMMGQIWRGLQKSEQAPYTEKAQALRSQYDKKLQKFFEKHPEQKSKKQLKKQKSQSKKDAAENNESFHSAPLVKQTTKSTKKPIVIQEQNSESV